MANLKILNLIKHLSVLHDDVTGRSYIKHIIAKKGPEVRTPGPSCLMRPSRSLDESLYAPAMPAVSILRPGPIDEVSVTLRM